MGFLEKIDGLLHTKAKPKESDTLQLYQNLVKKEPGNARAHLKLAEIYQKKGDRQKATSEYLLAAEIFAKNNFYARAMAIYKQVPRRDPSLDHVHLKIADIYRKMGFLGDAFNEYRLLVRHYDNLGMKDKALEVMLLMSEMDPRKSHLREKIKSFKNVMPLGNETTTPSPPPAEPPAELFDRKPPRDFFDLNAELELEDPTELKDFEGISDLEKIYGFEEIFQELKEHSGPSSVDPNFNYNMGVACREMEFIDDAIEQFQIALEKGQCPYEAANLLGICYKEKGRFEEARQAFEKALKAEGISPAKKLEVNYELGLLYKEQGKTEEALKLLRQISTVDQGFRNTKEEIQRLSALKNKPEMIRKK